MKAHRGERALRPFSPAHRHVDTGSRDPKQAWGTWLGENCSAARSPNCRCPDWYHSATQASSAFRCSGVLRVLFVPAKRSSVSRTGGLGYAMRRRVGRETARSKRPVGGCGAVGTAGCAGLRISSDTARRAQAAGTDTWRDIACQARAVLAVTARNEVRMRDETVYRDNSLPPTEVPPDPAVVN